MGGLGERGLHGSDEVGLVVLGLGMGLREEETQSLWKH